MKRDARALDHKTLEEFRVLALRRVREGEKASVVDLPLFRGRLTA